MNKKGDILTENVIFIILNVVFLTILGLFLVLKTGDVAGLEERYSKQIALMIDGARPGMDITINIKDAIDEATEKNFPIENIINFDDNVVNFKLRDEGGSSYSFFNQVNVNHEFYPATGDLRLIIKDKTITNKGGVENEQ